MSTYKAVAILTDYSAIPSELKSLKQWVCWGGEKVPKNPYSGGNAMPNNHETWSDFDTAQKAVTKYKFDGIGFMFANGYFGVDLDKCIDDSDFIDEFVHTLNSYTEYSKSKNGIHIICKGSLPDGQRRKGRVEMYQSGRYFIMTGNVYGELRAINDCTDLIKMLHAKHLETTPKVAEKMIEFTRLELTDNEIIDKARSCKNGMYFEALYRGNWQGAYTSQSEADLAFANMLAFWCQRDFTQMDRIFRSSGLMRPKWDSMRSGLTYGARTLENSISRCSDVYTPEMAGSEHNLVVGVFGKTKNPAKRKEYDHTDTGNASRFTDKYRGNVKFSYQNKGWYYWNGKVWQEDLTGEVKKLSDTIIGDMKKEAFEYDDEEKQTELLKWATRTANTKQKQAMIIESQHLDNIPVLAGDFDSHADFLNCQNGIVNLRNGELIGHDSNYMLSKISYSEYNALGNKPERWLQFLDEVTDGDKELQSFLQKAVGYSLTGSTKEQCVFFLYGAGNNGKSTFLDIVTDIAGSYACNVQPETVMVKNAMQGSINTDIARMKGARFVTTVEPNESIRINEGLLKQLTGGDKVTARFLYGREFEFTPEFKLWMATNHKPIIRGTDLGIWRRIRMIPFTVNIPPDKVDKGLKYKLRKELPMILSWAIEGCRLWQTEGLKLPKSVQDITEEYKAEMDILSTFCNDCIETNYLVKEKACDIYDVYSSWCDENNEYKMSSTRFAKEFVKRYPEKSRYTDGIYYKNCKITELGHKFNHKPPNYAGMFRQGIS
jgi:putative DNA primase/helicase